MSDKLRSGVAVTPEFVSGETTPANKLNAISVQMRYATQQLEKAVGDIHGQSFPYASTSLTTLSLDYPRSDTGIALSGVVEKKLDIANLARLIGPASHLNPRSIDGTRSITESVPVGVHEFALRWIPNDATTITFSDATVFATLTANVQSLNLAGEYFVSDDGKVYTVSATNGGTATYIIKNPRFQAGYYNHPRQRFNVIPDPLQIAAGGAGIAWGSLQPDGSRIGTLPTISHAQSDYDRTSTTLADDDINYGEQILLPVVLTSNLTAGDQIPEGFLFVKNETTGKVYEDAVHYYNTNSTFTINGVDITDDINAGHKFSVITVGTDITSSIDDLRVKHVHHTHDRTFGEPFIHVDSLTGITEQAGLNGSYVASNMPGNFAPQYLHRDGWHLAYDNGWNDENAMRGDLFLSNTFLDPGQRVDKTGSDSFRIRFGSSSANIYKDSNDVLQIRGLSGANQGITMGYGGNDLFKVYESGGDYVSVTSGADFLIGQTSGFTGSPIGLYRPRPYFTFGSVNMQAGTPYVLQIPIAATIETGDIVAAQVFLQSSAGIWTGPNGNATYEFWVEINPVGPNEELQLNIRGSHWTTGVVGASTLYRVALWWV